MARAYFFHPRFSAGCWCVCFSPDFSSLRFPPPPPPLFLLLVLLLLYGQHVWPSLPPTHIWWSVDKKNGIRQFNRFDLVLSSGHCAWQCCDLDALVATIIKALK